MVNFPLCLTQAELADLVDNVCRPQPKLGDEVAARAGVSKDILNAHLDHLARGVPGADCAADRVAQTADDRVLLNGDNLAGLLCCLADQLLIQRLDGVDIDDPRIDALFFQQLAGLRSPRPPSGRWPQR